MSYRLSKYYPIDKLGLNIVMHPCDSAKRVKEIYGQFGYEPITGTLLNSANLRDYTVVRSTFEFHYTLVCENRVRLIFARDESDAMKQSKELFNRMSKTPTILMQRNGILNTNLIAVYTVIRTDQKRPITGYNPHEVWSLVKNY